MDKKHLLTALAIAVFLLINPARGMSAELSHGDFKYCADVSGPLDRSVLYQVHLPAEIVEHCTAGFPDARVLDSRSSEVPRVVIEENLPAETPDTYPLAITGYQANASSSTITMKLPEKYRPISVLDLEIPDSDFKKHVLLSGSNDNKNWQRVTEDDIYDFSSQLDLRKTKLQFNKVDYRYFRLMLIDGTTVQKSQQSISLKYQGLDFFVNNAGKKDIRIHAVEGRTAAGAEQPPVYDERSISSPSVQIGKDGNSIILFNTGLPVDRLAFDVSNPYYFRTVTVYGSDTGKDGSYRQITRRTIYRFPLSAEKQETKNAIEYRLPAHAFYRIVIENRNNPPLQISGVTIGWIRKDLYFVALASGERYSLCFGNNALRPPDYDLERFVTPASVRQQRYEIRTAGPVRENADYAPRTPGEKKAKIEKMLLTSVIVVLVAGMGFWLYSLMKKAGEKK